MSAPISFTLDVEPQSIQFGAMRVAMIGGKPRIYPDQNAKNFRLKVAKAALPHRPKRPIIGPLALEVCFVMPRPERLNTKSAPVSRVWSDKRPDTTNLLKGLEDVLTKARFWEDDGQISHHVLDKKYAARGETPRIEITITPLYPELHPQEQLPL